MTRWFAMPVGQGMRVTDGADSGSRPCLIRHRMDDDENSLICPASGRNAGRERAGNGSSPHFVKAQFEDARP